MKTYEFTHNLVENIGVKFQCQQCGKEVVDFIWLPGIQSIDGCIAVSKCRTEGICDDNGDIECANCGEIYSYNIMDTILVFDDLDETYSMDFIEDFDEELFFRIYENIYFRSRKSIFCMPWDGWHKHNGIIDTDKKNSSQALSMDLWGCVLESPYRNKIINKIVNIEEGNWQIFFEWVDEENRINETYFFDDKEHELIDGRTRIDVILKSKNIIILSECKFTEKDDKCSQIKEVKKNSIMVKQCNGKYEMQINPLYREKGKGRCALSQKRIKYWDYLSETYSVRKDDDYFPCPFAEQYQIMRNICLGAVIEKYEKVTVRNLLVYLDHPKCDITKKIKYKNYEDFVKNHLKEKERLKIISYQDIIKIAKDVVSSIDKNEYMIWENLGKWIEEKADLL